MTDPGPAAELREAAKRLRKLATAATPGPWSVTEQHGRDIADEAWSDVRVSSPAGDVAITYLSNVIEGGDENEAYIASMHPAVALAVADWLDRFADLLYCYGPAEFDHALAIARAFLGTGETR